MSGDRARHSLDAIGRLHFAVHRAMRDLDYPGFACQLHVWLGGPADPGRLRRGLDNLVRRYPLLAARLVYEPGRRGDIYWEPRLGATCPLEVTRIGGEDAGAVHALAAALLERPFDLIEGEPLRVHLVQRGAAGDVLILYYDHTLIGDSQAAVRLVGEMDALADVAPESVRPAPPEPDEIEPYVTSHGKWGRWVGTVRMLRLYGKLRPALMLADDACREPAHDTCRILVGSLDERQTRALVERTRRVSGFPNVSLGLLASCFRALHRAVGSPAGRDRAVATGVGYSLRPASRSGAVFRWFGSEMILSAGLDELADRDVLTRLLVQRMRWRLRRKFDVASLHMARLGSRHVERVRRGFRRRMRDLSFSYGYFRPIEEGVRAVGGQPVERAHHLILPWTPPGLTVSAATCRGRLEVLVGTGERAVSAERARAFVQYLLEDLAD
jgi:hypothetical protein